MTCFFSVQFCKIHLFLRYFAKFTFLDVRGKSRLLLQREEAGPSCPALPCPASLLWPLPCPASLPCPLPRCPASIPCPLPYPVSLYLPLALPRTGGVGFLFAGLQNLCSAAKPPTSPSPCGVEARSERARIKASLSRYYLHL